MDDAQPRRKKILVNFAYTSMCAEDRFAPPAASMQDEASSRKLLQFSLEIVCYFVKLIASD